MHSEPYSFKIIPKKSLEIYTKFILNNAAACSSIVSHVLNGTLENNIHCSMTKYYITKLKSILMCLKHCQGIYFKLN